MHMTILPSMLPSVGLDSKTFATNWVSASLAFLALALVIGPPNPWIEALVSWTIMPSSAWVPKVYLYFFLKAPPSLLTYLVTNLQQILTSLLLLNLYCFLNTLRITCNWILIGILNFGMLHVMYNKLFLKWLR